VASPRPKNFELAGTIPGAMTSLVLRGFKQENSRPKIINPMESWDDHEAISIHFPSPRNSWKRARPVV
jgi:hypothetical protein